MNAIVFDVRKQSARNPVANRRRVILALFLLAVVVILSAYCASHSLTVVADVP
jgi:hypothetical protein